MSPQQPRSNAQLRKVASGVLLATWVATQGCDGKDHEVGVYEEQTGGADSGADSAFHAPGTDSATPSPDASEECGWVDALPTHILPTVWLVIEMSGQMVPDEYEQVSRRFFAPGPENVLEAVHSDAKIGALFHGGSSADSACPQVRVVEPAVNNLERLRQALPAQPAVYDFTSTQASYAYDHIQRALASGGEPPSSHAIVYIRASTMLATLCQKDLRAFEEKHGYPTTDVTAGNETIKAQIAALAAMGTLTYPFEPVGFANPIDSREELARLGGTQMSYFNDSEYGPDVREAFRKIVGKLVSCEVPIHGTVRKEDACKGRVRVGDATIPCDSANGYRLKGDSVIELVGGSCDALRANPTLRVKAEFPCGVILF